MKLTIFALLATVALAMTTSAPAKPGTSYLGEKTVPIGFPRNIRELQRMIEDFEVNSYKPVGDKIDVEKWHSTRMHFKVLEAAAEWIQPKLNSHEKWEINHAINQIKQLVISPRDAKAVQECDLGDKSEFCDYYKFDVYSRHVQNIAFYADELTRFYASDNQDVKAQASIGEAVVSSKEKIDKLRAAPVEFWETEPMFEQIQNMLKKASGLVEAALAASQAKHL
ncbi:hypothetical protein OXX69_011998 [Metschnikowia pulcherrima]